MPETAMVASYIDAETHMLSAANGVEYAYRTAGAPDGTPLVALQHFRGNLDNPAAWVPRVDSTGSRGSWAMAAERPRCGRCVDGARTGDGTTSDARSKTGRV
jgi:hypothetical protein